MPVLNATPLETVLPAHTRRRTWVRPELTSHSLLVLTFDRLHLAPLAGDPKPELLAAVESGADLDDVLGPLAVVIDLVAVRGLKLDLLTNSIAVEYVGGGLGTSRQRITFATPEAADACFTKIWRRLGDGLKLTPYRGDSWSVVRGPLLLLLGSLLATALLVLVISVFEDFAGARAAVRSGATAENPLGLRADIPKTPLELILGWIDWRLVCALGGAAAAVSQVWLYRRLTTPPVSLELVRE